MDHMKKRTSIALLVLVGAAAVAAYTTRSSWTGGNTNAQAPQRARIVAVEIAKAERKPVPVDVDPIGRSNADFECRAQVAGGNHHHLGAF